MKLAHGADMAQAWKGNASGFTVTPRHASQESTVLNSRLQSVNEARLLTTAKHGLVAREGKHHHSNDTRGHALWEISLSLRICMRAAPV